MQLLGDAICVSLSLFAHGCKLQRPCKPLSQIQASLVQVQRTLALIGREGDQNINMLTVITASSATVAGQHFTQDRIEDQLGIWTVTHDMGRGLTSQNSIDLITYVTMSVSGALLIAAAITNWTAIINGEVQLENSSASRRPCSASG